jgi:anthranilate synthase/aminodeoxychorismate synthase-like glutamine amidotransferase
MVLVINNHDSFTYNIVQILKRYTDNVLVKRNDEITIKELEKLNPGGVLISPGPGRPELAGITPDVIRSQMEKRPILGICLGHQAIGYVFGGTILRAGEIFHGRSSPIHHDERTIFKGLVNPFPATRYHSLQVASEKFPSELEISAKTREGVIMGIRHRKFPIEGIQFHPESILTDEGEKLIRNWLKMI